MPVIFPSPFFINRYSEIYRLGISRAGKNKWTVFHGWGCIHPVIMIETRKIEKIIETLVILAIICYCLSFIISLFSGITGAGDLLILLR